MEGDFEFFAITIEGSPKYLVVDSVGKLNSPTAV